MKKVAVTNRFDNKFDTYCLAIEKAGGIATELEKNIFENYAEKTLRGFDCLLLTGGGDVDPKRYNEPNTHSKGIIFERDETEIALVKAARKMNLPTLGICRGMQVANVAFGGTLLQDVIFSGFCNHSLPERKFELVHGVKKINDGILPHIFGEKFSVNSSHHQAIDKIADCFLPTLLSDDGIVEGMEDKKARFFVFVQFHPEILLDIDERFLRLFEAFLAA